MTKDNRPLEERVVEYRDNLLSIRGQVLLLADQIEKRDGDAQLLRDAAKFYNLVADDLTKVIEGEQLERFEVSGVLPD